MARLNEHKKYDRRRTGKGQRHDRDNEYEDLRIRTEDRRMQL